MPLLQTDDAVHRFMGSVIHLPGWNPPIRPRYDTLGVFLAVTGASVLIAHFLLWFGWSDASIYASGVGLAAALAIQKYLERDITLTAFYELTRNQARTWAHARWVNARHAPRPARRRGDRVHLRGDLPR